jgi:hypothetical protein
MKKEETNLRWKEWKEIEEESRGKTRNKRKEGRKRDKKLV